MIVCRDAAMSSQTCFVSAPSIDTETTPFFDDVAFKGSAVVLNLRVLLNLLLVTGKCSTVFCVYFSWLLNMRLVHFRMN